MNLFQSLCERTYLHHLCHFCVQIVPFVSGQEPDPKKRKVETLTSLDRIMHNDMKRKEAKGRKDYWLHPNIVVKVLNKKVGQGKYYRQKGVNTDVSGQNYMFYIPHPF